MSERAKKILLVVGFIASVLGIGAALYFVFFKPVTPIEPTVNPDGEQPGAGGEFPSSGTGGGVRPGGTTPIPTQPGELPDEVANGGPTVTTTLTTGSVESTAITASNTVNFYDPKDGRFYTIDAEGNIVALSTKQFPEADNIAWNEEADKAIIEFPDGSNIVYDFSAETQVTLPNHWEELEFSTTSDDIAAESIGLDPNNRWLVISNADGSNVEAVQALGSNADKVEIAWSPNDQVIAFSNTADALSGGLDRQMILPIGKNEENFKGLVVEGLDFTPNWSPDGRQLLYSVVGEYSDNKPLLWIVDATATTMGENRRSLGLNTWADKCAFTTASAVYCAVPQGLPENTGLQRSLVDDLPDSLYRIDLATGKSSLVAIPEVDTTMDSLTVASDESAVYYINGTTGKLETIRLK